VTKYDCVFATLSFEHGYSTLTSYDFFDHGVRVGDECVDHFFCGCSVSGESSGVGGVKGGAEAGLCGLVVCEELAGTEEGGTGCIVADDNEAEDLNEIGECATNYREWVC
jgi:hypothetical protein